MQTPLGTNLNSKVIQPFLANAVQSRTLQKPILVHAQRSQNKHRAPAHTMHVVAVEQLLACCLPPGAPPPPAFSWAAQAASACAAFFPEALLRSGSAMNLSD